MIRNQSKKLQLVCSFLIFFTALAMCFGYAGCSFDQAAEPSAKYEAPVAPPSDEPLPPNTGGRAPEMDLSYLTGQKMPEKLMALAQALPASWDWRAQGKVTPVKDQAGCGACYAFAAIGAIESKLLIDGAGAYDFSENNAKECNWRELNDYGCPDDCWGSCDGGSADMLASLFTQKGLVLESCDPYVNSDVDCKGTCPYQITLLDGRMICGNVVPDTDVLKGYIQTYGPVGVSMYVDASQGFDSTYDGSYTFNYSWPTTATTDTNHGVLIVGWSDNLPPVPGGTEPADGWIVKNSWGLDWGENGYFYITYGSANIGMYASFVYDWQFYDTNGGIMYYDEDGQSTAWGYGDDTTGWGLVKFFPASDTYITRVEFWTTDKTTDIDVYIYDDFDGTTLSNKLWQSLDHSFNEAGYHGVTVDPPLAAHSGDDVIAVVKFTNESYPFPIPADINGPHETGRTYSSGSGVTWFDEGNDEDDIAIRLRTSSGYAPNNPPYAPSAPSPVDHAADVSISANVSWIGGDPDAGDTVTYDVYFGTGSTPPLVSHNQAGSSYDPGTMAYNTKYYWKIVSTDDRGASTTGPLWDFTSGSPPNRAPNTPSDASPANHATDVDINADLGWTGGDPDVEDAVTYDVYFGTNSSPPLVSDNWTGTSYDPGTLSNDTKYYWQILATDNHGASTTGPLWDFTTSMAGEPDITVFPTSFDVTLPSNKIQDYTLTIGNTGDRMLTYSISDRQMAAEVIAVQRSQGSLPMQPGYRVLGVPLESSPAEPEDTREAQSGWHNIMIDGFEGTFPGLWQVWAMPYASDSYWGKDGYSCTTGLYSVFCAKNGTAGVNPPANYPNDMEAWMVYGPFSLADASDAELNFQCWVDAEYSWDYFSWVASVDGTNFYYGSALTGNTGGWVNESFDLTDVDTLGNLCGQVQVWIAFVFESDESNTGEGAFIDDVVLRKYTGAANNPPNTPSSPSPSNRATGVSLNADLSWVGGDPDTGDTVNYDVYFGTSSTPPLVSNDQSGAAYNPGTLAYNTKYYWKIIATDNHGASTSGPVWDFTTIVAEDCPWLDENPRSGGVEPDNSDSVTIVIDTGGLADGDYSAEIVVSSNDAKNPVVTVPVVLHVSPWDLTIASTAGGTVTIPGIGTFAYDEGTVVDLVATPGSGYEFVNWTGDVSTVANVDDATTTVTMNGDYTISANFEAIPKYDLTIASTAGGLVTAPGEGTFPYEHGAGVSLLAEAEEGYDFDNWTGDVDTIADVDAASTTITMNDDYSITANFKVKRSGGICFIATAAYGTPMAQEVQTLRDFRDEYLLTNLAGQTLVDLYYGVSPPIAEFISEHPGLQPIVRAGLRPAVAMSTVAISPSPVEKMATVGSVLLILLGLAVWAKAQRGRGRQYT